MNFPLGFGSGAIGLKFSLLSFGVEGFRCVAAFGPDSPAPLSSSTAATLASLEAIKARVTELHLEQLLQRERPTGRSAEGWQNILSTAQRTLEAHLATLDTPAHVWDFAHRCLKDSLLKDAFRFFAVEDVCDEAVSEALVKLSYRQRLQLYCMRDERKTVLFFQQTRTVFRKCLRLSSDSEAIDSYFARSWLRGSGRNFLS